MSDERREHIERWWQWSPPAPLPPPQHVKVTPDDHEASLEWEPPAERGDEVAWYELSVVSTVPSPRERVYASFLTNCRGPLPPTTRAVMVQVRAIDRYGIAGSACALDVEDIPTLTPAPDAESWVTMYDPWVDAIERGNRWQAFRAWCRGRRKLYMLTADGLIVGAYTDEWAAAGAASACAACYAAPDSLAIHEHWVDRSEREYWLRLSPRVPSRDA